MEYKHFANEETGIRGLVPEGWVERGQVSSDEEIRPPTRRSLSRQGFQVQPSIW